MLEYEEREIGPRYVRQPSARRCLPVWLVAQSPRKAAVTHTRIWGRISDGCGPPLSAMVRAHPPSSAIESVTLWRICHVVTAD